MRQGMMKITAGRLERDGFEPFGSLYRLGAPEPDGRGEAGIVRSSGDGWSDAFTRHPLLTGSGSLGMTLGEGGDFVSRRMERHPDTQEALFCAADPILLAVAPPGEAASPKASDVRAFVIEPGTVVVLHKGTWHDACRGLQHPAYYYWMAITGGGAVWVDIEGGPVAVLPPEAAHA